MGEHLVGRSWLPLGEGFRHGLAASLVGWSLHGGAKFLGYNMLREELHDVLPWGPSNTYLFASLTAETVATLLLAPFHTSEVKLVSDPLFAPSLIAALLKIIRLSGVRGLFAGLPVLLLRQLVAGFCKFHLFEKCARASFNYLEPGYAKDRKIKRYHRVAGVLFSSLVTSAVCAIVSNPFDVIYTHIAASPSPLGVLDVYAQVGLTGLFAGVGYRVASTTLNNFFIWVYYDLFKELIAM
ncbi:carrier superfamily protein [Acanthamoeba castellanii str. Neff]|uniref:Carrier superfamily protein n=1 Tax=Acanthamoeba castellanii (strain ATCC 30010 / Neff) TaxID=1257118 RepID=L8GNE6_ACACF|nr:carrier superfamily protein [Acanthamoeba castellanii str. Neff]ELR14507.1 carrier superfamily protein [Acanthamoeba castellanii str. Neff]